MDASSAKQFFISKVIEEAEFERVRLSEIEEKMLHFTEVPPSLPDIYQVNAEFERDYDSDEYEAKIVGLLKNARDRDSRSSPNLEQEWKDALDALKKEDHYILVMLYCAFPEYRKTILPTHRVRDYMIYIAIGIALVLALIGFAAWRH
ncbi:MAG TPA: hypothetical protein VEK84_17140 [Terriglobales bacterium]|nr:hypothetical protein [Terriglobales bacterium]